jgi:hypothetical protein
MPGIFYKSGDEGSAPKEKSSSVPTPSDSIFQSGGSAGPSDKDSAGNNGDQESSSSIPSDLKGEPDQRHKG